MPLSFSRDWGWEVDKKSTKKKIANMNDLPEENHESRVLRSIAPVGFRSRNGGLLGAMDDRQAGKINRPKHLLIVRCSIVFERVV